MSNNELPEGKSKGGCLGYFIAFFICVWFVFSVFIGVNFFQGYAIQQRCLNQGICPQIEIQNHDGTTTIKPVIPK